MKNPLTKIIRQILNKEDLLQELISDLEKEKETLSKCIKSKNIKELTEFYEERIKVNTERLERYELYLRKLLNKVKRYIDQNPESSDTLGMCYERILQFLNQMEEIIEATDHYLLDLIREKKEDVFDENKFLFKTIVNSLDEILEKFHILNAEFLEIKNMKELKTDNIPYEIYYGEHLKIPKGAKGLYHRDCKSYKGRFKFETRNIHLPKLRWTFIKKPKILDAGCSIGISTYEIQQEYKNAKVIGLELNKKSLEKAKKYQPEMVFLLGDLNHLESYFKKEYFNIVFMGNNISFSLSRNEDLNILKSAWIILKPEGYLVIYDTSCAVVLQKKEFGFKVYDEDHGEKIMNAIKKANKEYFYHVE